MGFIKKTKTLKQAVSKLDKHKMKTRSANKNVSQEKVSNPSMDKLDIVDENLTSDANENSCLSNDYALINPNLYCYPFCNIDTSQNNEIIQCSLCLIKIHLVCSDADKISKSSWKCERCRNISEDILHLKQQVAELNNALSSIIDKEQYSSQKYCDLVTENNHLKEVIHQLKAENYNLRIRHYNRFNSLSSDSSSDSDSCSDDAEESWIPKTAKKTARKCSPKTRSPTAQSQAVKTSASPTRPTLSKTDHQTPSPSPSSSDRKNDESSADQLSQSTMSTTTVPTNPNVPTSTTGRKTVRPRMVAVGGSMIRSTGETISKQLHNFDTCVYSISGLQIDNARKEIVKIVDSFTDQDVLVLHVGTNDIVNSSHHELLARYGNLLDSVKQTAPECNVIVSGLSYRMSHFDNHLNSRIENFNGALRMLCLSYQKCCYREFNPPAVSSFYKSDGLHFNPKGTELFARSLTSFINSTNFYFPLNKPVM